MRPLRYQHRGKRVAPLLTSLPTRLSKSHTRRSLFLSTCLKGLFALVYPLPPLLSPPSLLLLLLLFPLPLIGLFFLPVDPPSPLLFPPLLSPLLSLLLLSLSLPLLLLFLSPLLSFLSLVFFPITSTVFLSTLQTHALSLALTLFVMLFPILLRIRTSFVYKRHTLPLLTLLLFLI